MTNKKILNFIPNFSFGGVETTNINLSETLIKFGYEVELLTNDYQIVNKSEYLDSRVSPHLYDTEPAFSFTLLTIF